MIIAGIVLLVLIFLILVLLFSPFLVILSVSEKNLTVKIRVLKITIQIPLQKKEKTEEAKEENQDSVLQKFLEMRNNFTRIRGALEKALSYLSRKIHIHETGVVGKFGLGNAAVTGMSYGMVEAFAGMVTGFLQHYFSFDKAPYRNLQLEYDKLVFELKFAMIVKTKPIYLLKAALIFLKYRKQ